MRLTERDQRLVAALALCQAPMWMDRLLRWITHAGDAATTIAISLLLLSIPATRQLGIIASLANLGSHVLVQPILGIPALLVAMAVGVSRVYLRVHYPTDVLVGQALGAGAALLVSSSLS